MERGSWQATVHGVTESDMTEQPSTVGLLPLPYLRVKIKLNDM